MAKYDKQMFNAPIVKHEVATGIEVFGEVKCETSNVKRGNDETAAGDKSPSQIIKVKELNPAGKARIWNVYDQKETLVGVIRYYRERNRYVFEPEGWQVFDSEMMERISLIMRDEKLAERQIKQQSNRTAGAVKGSEKR